MLLILVDINGNRAALTQRFPAPSRYPRALYGGLSFTRPEATTADWDGAGI